MECDKVDLVRISTRDIDCETYAVTYECKKCGKVVEKTYVDYGGLC